jgi:serine/threonine-protein kinase
MNVVPANLPSIGAGTAPNDSLSAVAAGPRRVPIRAIAVVVLAVVALGVLAASRFQGRAAPVPAAVAAPKAAPPARSVGMPASGAPNASGWIPVMPLPGTDSDPGVSAAALPEATGSAGAAIPAGGSVKRPAGIGPATAGPSRPTASPGASARAASCDPPFWIDGDGTKRYYRHCVSP